MAIPSSRMVNGEAKPISNPEAFEQKEAQVAAAQIGSDLHKGLNLDKM
ncbi:hypothetical protein [Sporosarcina jiandibaonis]|nr:hypothetical protein [Sporosarcina jiandibaonis]